MIIFMIEVALTYIQNSRNTDECRSIWISSKIKARAVHSVSSCRKQIALMMQEWYKKISVISEIHQRVSSKRVSRNSKTFLRTSPVPFDFGLENWEFLVEWKPPFVLPAQQVQRLARGEK